MDQQKKGLEKVRMIDFEDSDDGNGAGDYVLDPNNPVLQPPKDSDAKPKKTWKRRLIGWLLVLLLVGAGVGALYLLMRAKRVNVTVNAESRKNTQSTKPQNEMTNSDSGLTADAINIARQDAGLDLEFRPRNSASPVPSPSPSPGLHKDRKLDFTGDSPVLGNVGKSGDADSNSQTNVGSTQAKTDASSEVVVQSHANPTQSLFVDDVVPKSAPAPAPIQPRRESNAALTTKPATPTVPPFGTMLPVRTQGVIFTLRNNSYARLELNRDTSGNGWSLPKGTVLLGRTTGSEQSRAFVNIIGYIDPRENKLVPLTGDVLGSDGANGIPGKRIAIDRESLKQTLRKVGFSSLQVASTMAGALSGRGAIVIDGASYRLRDPLNEQARSLINENKNSFVKVEAGQQAYVMVTDLPGRVEGVDAPGTEESTHVTAASLTDREVMELILFGTAEDIRAAMPLMTEEQKRLAIRSRSQESGKP